MWSIGVITYSLLAAYPPFNADNDAQLFRKIKFCDYEFHKDVWSEISDDAKRFISSCLQSLPDLRMKPLDALNHPWILKNTKKDELDPSILETIKRAKRLNEF